MSVVITRKMLLGWGWRRTRGSRPPPVLTFHPRYPFFLPLAHCVADARARLSLSSLIHMSTPVMQVTRTWKLSVM